MQNEDYLCHAHFLINKSALKKSQLKFVEQLQQDKQVDGLIKNLLKEQDIITEFIPTKWVKDGTEMAINICEHNNVYYGIQEKYYNFLKDIDCKLYIIDKSNNSPIHIYKDNELIGIILPCRVRLELMDNSISLTEHIKQLQEVEEQEQQRKESMKKCLYISNNKAVARNKELACIADIINDPVYKNLYVEADYKNDFGEIFIDLGFVYMGIGKNVLNDLKTLRNCTIKKLNGLKIVKIK